MIIFFGAVVLLFIFAAQLHQVDAVWGLRGKSDVKECGDVALRENTGTDDKAVFQRKKGNDDHFVIVMVK